MEEIVNRVSKSPLVSIDLDEFFDKGEVEIIDIKNLLFQGLILKEKDFRNYLKSYDWSTYEGKNIGVICSVEAIIPTWAYMLLTSKLKPFAKSITFGDEIEVEKKRIEMAIDEAISSHDLEGKKVVVKGCGNLTNREYAYTRFTDKILGQVTSLMYGEPCSTVPIYKKKVQ